MLTPKLPRDRALSITCQVQLSLEGTFLINDKMRPKKIFRIKKNTTIRKLIKFYMLHSGLCRTCLCSKYLEQRPMRERRECKMQNFISFLMVLLFFFEISKNFLKTHFIIYQKCPFNSCCTTLGYLTD